MFFSSLVSISIIVIIHYLASQKHGVPYSLGLNFFFSCNWNFFNRIFLLSLDGFDMAYEGSFIVANNACGGHHHPSEEDTGALSSDKKKEASACQA